LIPSDLAANVIATVHPSSILCAQDDESRHLQLAALVDDLKQVALVMRGGHLKTARRRDNLRRCGPALNRARS
jgi:hypothetical protein